MYATRKLGRSLRHLVFVNYCFGESRRLSVEHLLFSIGVRATIRQMIVETDDHNGHKLINQ